jgi:hypothetical protein
MRTLKTPGVSRRTTSAVYNDNVPLGRRLIRERLEETRVGGPVEEDAFKPARSVLGLVDGAGVTVLRIAGLCELVNLLPADKLQPQLPGHNGCDHVSIRPHLP